MKFSELSSKEKGDFRNRLKQLDLDESALISDELVVEEGSQKELSLTEESSIRPRVLETTDLDKVRQWVGAPEGILSAEINRPTRRLNTSLVSGLSSFRTAATSRLSDHMMAISGISAAKLTESVRRYKSAGEGTTSERLKTDELEVLRHAAYTYVRGDRALAESYKTAIENFFVKFEIPAWLFTSIHVKKNAVLQFGQGAHNLTAYKIILEKGATIRNYGHLTVNCSVIERKKGPSITLPSHVATSFTVGRRPLRRFS